jgi:hypothetical protein
MQELRDIFGIWKSLQAMADELNEWRTRGRIPSHAWPKIIEKAARHEKLVTAQQLLDLNMPRRKRKVA